MADEPLSVGKYGAVVIVMALSSCFSIFGSVAIVRIASLKLTSTYQRFLFMLSISDITSSVFLLFHHFVVPKDPDFYWAVGNDNTCTMAGFFLQFGSLVAAFYNCWLAVYFDLSIRSNPKRQKQPEEVIGKAESLAHISSWVIPAAFAATAAASNRIGFYDGLGMCMIHDDLCSGPDDPDCVKYGWGNDALFVTQTTKILSLAYYATLAVVSIVAVTATALVFSRVRTTFLRGREYGTEGELSDETKQRLSAVAIQAVLYTAMYLNSFLWPSVLLATSFHKSQNQLFPLHLIASFMFPLQGAMNCIIYIRPRFQMLRAMYPNDSFMVVLRVALSTAGDPDEIEDVREAIYGDAYESPSVQSSDPSLASDMPCEVEFNPSKALSETSLVSTPDDNDDMDPEAHGKKKDPPEEQSQKEAKST
jgi:hypothetical protein